METMPISKNTCIPTEKARQGAENSLSPVLTETQRRPVVPEAPYFQNILPLQLKEHVLTAILAICDPNERRWPLRELGLSLDSTSEEIEKAVLDRIDNYLTKYDELKEMLPRRIEIAEKWLEENSFRPSQDVRDVPVVLYDRVLALTRPDDRRTAPALASFRPDINTIVMSLSATETELAHEYGHAASYSSEGGRVGWANIDQEGSPINGRDNRWLDEGCTITAEMATSGITLEQYQAKNPQYAMYYVLTRTLREELGVSEHDLMQSYFAESPEREDFERKVQERYKCSVFELGGILIGDYDWERQNLALLTGEPVELEAPGEPDEYGMYEKYQWLAKTFPNVTLKRKAGRASQNIEASSESITAPDARETEIGDLKS